MALFLSPPFLSQSNIFPPSFFCVAVSLFCPSSLAFRSRGLPQPSERRVLSGSGLSGEMPLRGHGGRLFQPQTDTNTATHPRIHHRPVSQQICCFLNEKAETREPLSSSKLYLLPSQLPTWVDTGKKRVKPVRGTQVAHMKF